MTNYLVTGGAGFIGSHIADRLLESGNHVCVIDNFDPYYSRSVKEQNIKHNLKNKNYIFIEGDIKNTEVIKKIIKKHNIKKIFHIAARAGVRFSVKDPNSYHDINVNGTLSLLNASLAMGVKRIVYASSSSVYGIEKNLPVDESHPTQPISPYGASKLAAEAFCNSFMHVFGLPVVSLRYFTVYGPRQRPDMAIHKFTKTILTGKTVTIYGDGNQTRDFTFVSDIVDGTIKAMQADATGIFNLGSGRRITVNELIKVIEKITDRKTIKKHIEKQKGDVSDTWADVKKARKTFNYKPKIKIKEGVEIFYKWFEKNVVSNNTNIQ